MSLPNDVIDQCIQEAVGFTCLPYTNILLPKFNAYPSNYIGRYIDWPIVLILTIWGQWPQMIFELRSHVCPYVPPQYPFVQVPHWQKYSISTYVTWSRGMSRMSGILILSYRLKEVINSYVLHCFLMFKNCSYLCNQMSDWDGVWIKM